MELCEVYNMASNQGYPPVPKYAVLAARMGVPVTAVKNWYTEERKAKGHSGNFHTSPKSKGKPPAVEVCNLHP